MLMKPLVDIKVRNGLMDEEGNEWECMWVGRKC
jgi:hypothetical protein